MDTRPFQDFELMGVAGVTDVLTLAHDLMRMATADVLSTAFISSFTVKGDEAPKMEST
jgi:uncharacterized protein